MVCFSFSWPCDELAPSPQDSSWDRLQPSNPENNAFEAVPKFYLVVVAMESNNVINQRGLLNEGSEGYFIRLRWKFSF